MTCENKDLSKMGEGDLKDNFRFHAWRIAHLASETDEQDDEIMIQERQVECLHNLRRLRIAAEEIRDRGIQPPSLQGLKDLYE